MKFEYPIDASRSEILKALSQNSRLILHAPTGSGKTTRVPLFIIEDEKFKNQKIILLEPKRLAAKAAAERLAFQIGQKVGEQVGYRVHLDQKVSQNTQVEVITEAILSRMLRNNPLLAGVGVVIFDEFHERNLETDLNLALMLELQKQRPELKIIVMSATINTQLLAEKLSANQLISEGFSYPVEVIYRGDLEVLSIVEACVQMIGIALNEQEGNILVFLPGEGEIRAVHSRLTFLESSQVQVCPLFGSMELKDQRSVLEYHPQDKRKIILATSIAESSLTIPGVRVVIDSGWARAQIYDPQSLLSTLITERVTQASADQRKGRAGRTQAGVCYRLWSERTQHFLTAHLIPQIERSELSSFLLTLVSLGKDYQNLFWLSALDLPPIKESLQSALALLLRLRALFKKSEEWCISEYGRLLSAQSAPVRLSHALLSARTVGQEKAVCLWVAFMSERDFLYQSAQVNLLERIDLLEARKNKTKLYGADLKKMDSILAWANELEKSLSQIPTQLNALPFKNLKNLDLSSLGIWVALAYPEWVALQRKSDLGLREKRYLMQNGKGVTLPQESGLEGVECMVICQLTQMQNIRPSSSRSLDAVVRFAAPFKIEWIRELFFGEIVQEKRTKTLKNGVLQAYDTEAWGSLVLSEKPSVLISEDWIPQYLSDLEQKGLDILPLNEEIEEWIRRGELASALNEQLPEISKSWLVEYHTLWLDDALLELKSPQNVTSDWLFTQLKTLYTWSEWECVQKLCPTHFVVPTGSKIKIDYLTQEKPILAVRLQEMFGLKVTPSVGNGKIPLLIHLLSPGYKPVQVTQDLVSFWQNSYVEVKKELKRRYPKHSWPDNPLKAEPVRKGRSEKAN